MFFSLANICHGCCRVSESAVYFPHVLLPLLATAGSARFPQMPSLFLEFFKFKWCFSRWRTFVTVVVERISFATDLSDSNVTLHFWGGDSSKSIIFPEWAPAQGSLCVDGVALVPVSISYGSADSFVENFNLGGQESLLLFEKLDVAYFENPLDRQK